MNEDMLRQIIELKYPEIHVHDEFIPEFFSILDNISKPEQVVAKFFARLDYLHQRKEAASATYSKFERLDEKLYSFHIESKAYNLRFLYSFLSDGTILLRPFYERQGKRSTDYTKNKKIAIDRLLKLEERK